MAEAREAMVQRMVRQSNLSQELSDLVVYCQPVPFDIESRLRYWHDKLLSTKQNFIQHAVVISADFHVVCHYNVFCCKSNILNNYWMRF